MDVVLVFFLSNVNKSKHLLKMIYYHTVEYIQRSCVLIELTNSLFFK